MRMSHFTATTLLLFPLCTFSNDFHFSTETIPNAQTDQANTISRSLSNRVSNQARKYLTRTIDFPTQVIRMTSPIQNQEIDCKQVHKAIDEILIKRIPKNQFSSTFFISCDYDPITKKATQFTIDGYFDPLTDNGVEYLKTYLNTYNGSNLLGAPLNIESSKGLIVTVNISAGVKENPNTPPLIEYREDRGTFFFKNDYEMSNSLRADIYERFLSDDPEKLLPFLDTWLFQHASDMYKNVLKNSNYVQLQPENIFLMDNGAPLFVPKLKYYFGHHCTSHELPVCLD